MIGAVSVVVPAHDEEELLPACLASLLNAARHPDLAGISVRIAVVLDRCSDASGDHADRLLRTCDLVLERHDGNVGAARRAGIDALERAEAGRALDNVWLATTDADSRVPPDWLAHQVRLANAGVDATAGSIALDDDGYGISRAFQASYEKAIHGTAHRHVHGANLGVRRSAYALAGGISGAPLGEDNALVDSLEACGVTIARPLALRVVTSGRYEGRAPGGFSQYLRELAARTPS
jgi:glycosyltransferase involved in cell wall biosynthesis